MNVALLAFLLTGAYSHDSVDTDIAHDSCVSLVTAKFQRIDQYSWHNLIRRDFARAGACFCLKVCLNGVQQPYTVGDYEKLAYNCEYLGTSNRFLHYVKNYMHADTCR